MTNLVKKEITAYHLCSDREAYIKGLIVRKNSLKKSIDKCQKELNSIESVLSQQNEI